MRTENLQFVQGNQTVIMPGAMQYRDAQVWIDAESAEYSFADQTGLFNTIDYGLSQSSANGSFASWELHPGERIG